MKRQKIASSELHETLKMLQKHFVGNMDLNRKKFNISIDIRKDSLFLIYSDFSVLKCQILRWMVAIRIQNVFESNFRQKSVSTEFKNDFSYDFAVIPMKESHRIHM